MTTTFITREIARDALVALYTTDNSWDLVFGYIPSADEIGKRSSFLAVSSAGTDPKMSGLDMNPTKYHFALRSFIRVSDTDQGGSWTEADCENRLDELDRVVRQVIRDNPGSGNYNYIFLEGPSTTGYQVLGGIEYRVEERTIIANYPSGGA